MTKIALVLGGDASPGAYAGGAVSELLRALEDNRRDCELSVGVVTATSFDAVTAGLAARSLVVNPSLVPWIESVWVEALDARRLLSPDRSDPDVLLDPTPIEELTAHMLAGPPASDDRPSAALDDELRLGLPLSRGETARFELDASRGATDPVWKEIREAVLAAVAHPPLLPALRSGLGASGRSGPGRDGRPAGALQLAARLVRDVPAREREDWIAVVVDPDATGESGGNGAAGGEGRRLRPGPASLAVRCALRQALGAPLDREWAEATDAAARFELLRALARRLPDIHGHIEDPDAVGLGRRIGELAERVAEREASRNGRPDGPGDPVLECLDANLERIQRHPAYAPAFADIRSRAGRTRLAKLVYVLEAVGGLDDGEPFPLLRITPEEPDSLAGGSVAGLGGFLHADWRRHDFTAGRRDARRLLEGPLADRIGYQPDDDEAYRPAPVRGGLDALPPHARQRLRSFLEAEIDRTLDRVRPGGLRGMFFGLARPGLRRCMSERALEALETV